MSEEKKQQAADDMYEKLCSVFKANDWHGNKNENERTIEFSFQEDELLVLISGKIDADKEYITFISPIPFVVEEEKKLEVAVAVTEVNSHLLRGNFYFNIDKGLLYFHLSSCYAGSNISEEAIKYLILCVEKTVSDFNRKFLLLSKGLITVDDIMRD